MHIDSSLSQYWHLRVAVFPEKWHQTTMLLMIILLRTPEKLLWKMDPRSL